jgi:tripartite-type tricarboxylate transporter receptor subunit TctC
MMARIFRKCGLSFLALALTMAVAHAQDYPNRAVRIIVPYPPGGGMDVTARVIGQKLGELLGQQFIIENRSGASGTIGTEAVVKATPDGYTLLLTPCDPFTAPALLPKMNFDPNKDLLPIAMVSDNPMVVVAATGAPFSDVKGFLEAAKASPNGMVYATPGSGSLNHAIGEWIGATAGIKLLQVPYKGGVEAADAIASGDVPIGIVSTPSVYPALVDAGKIKIIALTGAHRPAFVPSSWPTLVESGLSIDATIWVGIFAPTGTPDAIVAQLDQAIGRVLQDDLVHRRMNNIGFSPEYLRQSAFIERIHTDAVHYDQIIRQSGIAAER